MEKILIKNKADFEKAIEFFGKEYKNDISKNIKEYPFFLIGNYAEDIEFGTGYSFTSVSLSDFEESEICKKIKELRNYKWSNNNTRYISSQFQSKKTKIKP